MISKNMQNAINEQINAELWSAYLYLAMSMDAEAKALRGIANWFHIQFQEEQDHARIFQNYLNDSGAKVILKPISGVPSEWRSPLDMFRNTLAHEQDVTEMIHKLVKLAMEEGDFATLSRLQWFVDEQVEEEDTAAFHLNELDMAGKDYAAIRSIDKELGKREYAKPSPLE